MTWIFPTVLCAIFLEVHGVYARYLCLQKILGTSVILFPDFLFSFPIFFISAAEAVFQPIPKGCWPMSSLVVVGNVTGFYAFINALKFSEVAILAILPILVMLFFFRSLKNHNEKKYKIFNHLRFFQRAQ